VAAIITLLADAVAANVILKTTKKGSGVFSPLPFALKKD